MPDPRFGAALFALSLLASASSDAADSAPAPAQAAPETETVRFVRRASLIAEERLIAGVDEGDGMPLGLFGAGGRVRFAATLEAHALALGLLSAGSSELGEPARSGFGGELGVRLVPFPSWPVRPYVFGGAGLLLFLREPFMPGADVYEFMLSSGFGAELALDERWSIDAKGFAVHLSNGQGIGEHNPAYDGYGAGLALGYALVPREPLPGPWDAEPAPLERRSARSVEYPGVILDASAGGVDDASYLSARARVAQRASGATLFLADLERGTLAEEPFSEAGLAFVTHLGFGSLALHGGYRRYVGVDIGVAMAQAEAHVTRELSLVGMLAHERSRVFGSSSRLALGGRLHPLTGLVLELGVSFHHLADARPPANDDADPYLALEWAAPLSSSEWQLSVFAERHASNLDLVGLRMAYGMGATPRDVARREGFRRLR